MKAAVLDLGTNTFHLLIAEREPSGRIAVLHKEETFVKIGQGGISQGTILPEAQDRALKALRDFRLTVDRFGVPLERIMATATSAVRSASNGQAFLAQIKSETGFAPQVIDGEREAELIYWGVRSVMDIDRPTLICDVGGGSVEVCLCDRRTLYWKKSYEIGAQRLVDRFHRQEPIGQEAVRALNLFLEERLTDLLAEAAAVGPKQLVGTAGTFDTVREVHLQTNGLAEDDSPVYTVTADEYRAVHRRFVETTLQERLAIPGMLAPRAEMIVTASCVAHFLIERLRLPTVRLCRASLKEGAMAQLLR